MKTKNIFLLLKLLVLTTMAPHILRAQTTDVKVESEWVQVKKADIQPELLSYLETNGYVKYENPYLRPQQISDFMKNVVYFGSVTDITLSKITDNTNKFADTKLGTIAMILIAYNVAGQDLVNFFIRLLALVVFLTLYIIWWKRRMLPKSIVDTTQEDGVKNYKMQVPILWVQAVWLVLFLIASLFII
jgi:hypothetical protein